jgi:predicted nuclease of predicted toxin-antitoxin system
MVDPVADLLNGRGHPVRRARQLGLADVEDIVVIEYALLKDMVIVTFDPDFRSSARRQGARCLHIRTPERTARRRLTASYDSVVDLFWDGALLVTLPRDAPPERTQ